MSSPQQSPHPSMSVPTGLEQGDREEYLPKSMIYKTSQMTPFDEGQLYLWSDDNYWYDVTTNTYVLHCDVDTRPQSVRQRPKDMQMYVQHSMRSFLW